MSQTSVRVLRIESPAMPRGAQWVGQIFGVLSAAFPRAPKAPPTPAQEAAELRRMALGLQHSDPGFAADLMAAAARHEARDG